MLEIAFIGTKGIPARYGGFETAVEQVSLSLVKKGHKCIVYCTGNKKKYNIKNLTTINVPQTGIPTIDRVIRELFPIFHQWKNRDIIFHIYGPSIFMPILKLLRRKSVLSTDGFEWKRYSYSYLTRVIVYLGYKFGVKYATAVITDSKFIMKWYLKKWNRRSFYMSYGPRIRKNPPKKEINIKEKYDLKRNGYYLFVGRLVPEKGIHILIKAFNQLNSERKLVILGADPMVGEPYKKKLIKISNKNVIFLEPIFGEDFIDICKSCYAHIRPSINDSEGINPVLIESLGFGNCLIASDVPQNIEPLGDAAIFFPKGNVQILKNKLELIESNYDTVLLYREKALKRLKMFSWKNIIQSVEKIYLKL